MKSARQNYLADMAYILASGKRLRDDAKPFTEILRQPDATQDNRTGQEILDSIRDKIVERRRKGETV